MKLTLLKAVKLHQAITGLIASGDKLDKKLTYAMIRNQGKTKDVFEAVKAMETLSDGVKAFNDAVAKLDKNAPTAHADFAALKVEHKSALDAYEIVSEEVTEHLKTEEDFDLHMAPFEWLPDLINPAIQEALEPMITPPVEDAPKPV